jgi:DNA invertase Pin-like site-specific DNA recombinase
MIAPAESAITNRVVLYLRVSTSEQDLVGQERELVEEARRRGWVVVAIHREKVSATGKVERSEYDRLIQDAGQPERSWHHLLVWALDRFSRAETFTQATQAILGLEREGVRFHSLKEPMLDTPEDGRPNLGRDVLLAILPVIAGFESKRRSERVRVAMEDLKTGRRRTRSGRPVGRPRRMTPEKLGEMKRLRLLGLKWSEIARRVGLPRGTCAAAASFARRGITNTHGRERNR